MENSSYIADVEDRYELARLLRLDKLLTREMGEVFSQEQWASWQTVLDIACGPGGWMLDRAVAHPYLSFTGIDISQRMTRYARMLAQAANISNAQFCLMDARNRLDFPDQSFDSINARCISWFLSPDLWPKLLEECFRLLKPGGAIRITEYETAFSNWFGTDYANQVLFDALYRTGRSFSPTGRSAGISCMLKQLLREAGFVKIEHRGFCVDTGFGTEEFQGWKEDFLVLCRTIRPFIVQSGAMSEDAFEKMAQQIEEALESKNYSAMAVYANAWALKPPTDERVRTILL